MVPLNPFRNLPVSAATTERERVLSDEEIRDIWAAAAATSYPFGPFYQIAILTLQRRDEVAGMRWSEPVFSVDNFSCRRHSCGRSVFYRTPSTGFRLGLGKVPRVDPNAVRAASP